jgi:hypothetical protein
VSSKTPQQLADWLKEHLGPFPYGDHISLSQLATDVFWLEMGTKLHEFINGRSATVEDDG